jgi:hypothetical protein
MPLLPHAVGQVYDKCNYDFELFTALHPGLTEAHQYRVSFFALTQNIGGESGKKIQLHNLVAN